uniref:Uncharacterized protein n=1 Tax=Myoviridae sp. ct6F13 TaxID=2827602 RepID=A0A8S5LJE7_9CAUD|nr:MAG TPA: hypothetical protein [Myoviridae sp. ct6F13]
MTIILLPGINNNCCVLLYIVYLFICKSVIHLIPLFYKRVGNNLPTYQFPSKMAYLHHLLV